MQHTDGHDPVRCSYRPVARERLPGSGRGQAPSSHLGGPRARGGSIIVDVGSGPGYLTVELARAVGETGEVIAVDPSADMRMAAASQCNGFANVRILDGTANDLPLPDVCAAGAASLQVFDNQRERIGASARACSSSSIGRTILQSFCRCRHAACRAAFEERRAEDLKGGSRVRPFGARLLGILARGVFRGVFRGLSKLPG